MPPQVLQHVEGKKAPSYDLLLQYNTSLVLRVSLLDPFQHLYSTHRMPKQAWRPVQSWPSQLPSWHTEPSVTCNRTKRLSTGLTALQAEAETNVDDLMGDLQAMTEQHEVSRGTCADLTAELNELDTAHHHTQRKLGVSWH